MLISLKYLMLCRVLVLYLKGVLEVYGKWLFIFLCLVDSDKLEVDEKIFV